MGEKSDVQRWEKVKGVESDLEKKKRDTRRDRGRPLASKLLCLSSVFPFAGASLVCLDSASKTLFWLRCLVVCRCLPSIHLLQRPQILTIYSPFPPIFSLNYLFPPSLITSPSPIHTQENVLIHVRTLISSSITGHQWNASRCCRRQFKVQGYRHAESLMGYFAWKDILGGVCLKHWLKVVGGTFMH